MPKLRRLARFEDKKHSTGTSLIFESEEPESSADAARFGAGKSTNRGQTSSKAARIEEEKKAEDDKVAKNKLVQALKAHFMKMIDPEGTITPKVEDNIKAHDFVRTMTDQFEKDLDEAYQFNKAFARHLTQKVNNLQQFEK